MSWSMVCEWSACIYEDVCWTCVKSAHVIVEPIDSGYGVQTCMWAVTNVILQQKMIPALDWKYGSMRVWGKFSFYLWTIKL